MLSEFSREQMELPRQPNLGKNKAQLHRFQLCTRYRDIFRVNNRVFGVGELKYITGGVVALSVEYRTCDGMAEIAGVDIAGVDNDGANRRGGHCRSGQ